MIRTIFKNIISDTVLRIVFAIFLILWIFKPMNINDIDLDTIIILFNLMLIISLVKRAKILAYISNSIINHVQTTRQITAYITITSFVLSMFVTNDVSIITLVPLYLLIAKKLRLPLVYPTVLITIAANLGSAFTPIGNPQNVFLVEFYHISIKTFFANSFVLLILGLLSLLVLILLSENKQLQKTATESIEVNLMHLLMIIGLFILVLLAQFSVFSIWLDTIITVVVVEMFSPKSIADVDYSLLFSFVFFFLIVGMLSRIDLIVALIHQFMDNRVHTYITSIITSQFISNVPSAVLLSKFSADFTSIYYGVSIGGLGTLVASLANLLAYKQISLNAPHVSGNFLKQFTLINIILLLVLSLLKIILI
ncbi:carboxylate transporter [Lactobacillus kunkeei]|uniref:Carboxylate transporter n=1 Tax=Apilactobacillus nanyangensis TaxID=2799579 RepID=A0ABT0HWH2_9LACO|nr:SLC13 family permease [Apilactobacillus nanyangensis]MBC6388651.1 carboxylate transporter [Apilactobacillus kunkeei]MCK8611284.1 carboxylate transporter [Apilactobacillus nanyangensis]